jgi:hypothetical protein
VAAVPNIGPQYKEIVADLCQKIVDTHRANVSFYELVDSLNDDSVLWTTMVPMHANFLGYSKDKYSAPACYVRSAIKGGFFPASSLPVEWRE